MPEYLTYDRAVELLHEVVAEKGSDYVYPNTDGCRYVVDDQPSCLVARIFARAGRTVEELRAVEGYAPDSVGTHPQFADWADADARHLLKIAQSWQDDRYTWGDVVQLALESGDRDD